MKTVAKAARKRLRWELSDESVPSRDRPTVARTLIYLFGLGGTLVLVAFAVQGGDVPYPPGFVTPAVIALIVAAGLLVSYGRTPWWVLIVLPTLGAVLITGVIVSAGAGTISVYAALYFWVVLAVGSFFRTSILAANLVFIAALFGAAVLVVPDVDHGASRWLLQVGTVLVLAIVLSVLRRRQDRLADVLARRAQKQELIAEVGRQALEGAGVSQLLHRGAVALAEGLQVELASAFDFHPGTGELAPRASVGWDRPGEDAPVLAAADGLAEGAIASTTAVVEHSEQGSTIASAIPGPDGPVGVLAAHSRQPHEFDPVELAFTQSLAHVLGDAVERERAEREIEHQALHDHLTNRPNRMLFGDRLGEALVRAHAQGTKLAVFFIDIDDFKLINDGYGHAAGDEVLRALGPRLREALVMTDTIARFGGDEFAILCDGIGDVQHAAEIAQRMQQALSRPFEIAGAGYRVSASIGIAISGDESTADELVARADAAMYRAKERTRGGFEFYDAELRERVLKRLGYESALRAAPDGDELALAIQPIVSLPGGRPVGAEALLRWTNPDLGAVSPGDFIPIAEETGAIVPIGEWVMREAQAIAARCRSDPQGRRLLPLHVNVSARQLAQPDFLEMVKRGFARSGARYRDLSIEITEHAFIGDTAETVRALSELQDLGVHIVLDDFGTGFSSLSHLKQFPIDTVKIDRLFVSHLTSERKDEAIVSAVVGMADAFAIDVVAEGIETDEQAEHLTRLGCGFGQGYLFSKPLPLEELSTVVRTQSSASTPSDSSASSFVE